MSETDYNINWFPGHMAKAMRQIREKLNLCDVVIEVLDSRAPFSSINKALKEMIGDKPLLFVLNKIDMADGAKVGESISAYKDLCDFAEVVPVSALHGEGCDDLLSTIFKYLPEGPADNPQSQYS